jgi:hypothetical protein
MPFKESMNVLREFRTNSFRGGDLLHGSFSKPIHRPKLSQQEILPILTHARTIVEDAFANPFLHQELVIRIREAVGLVSNALEQTQRAGVWRKNQRQGATGPINLFVLLRETDDRQVV